MRYYSYFSDGEKAGPVSTAFLKTNLGWAFSFVVLFFSFWRRGKGEREREGNYTHILLQ